MHWPQRLTVHCIARARDGGSQILLCTDERGVKRRIELNQMMFLKKVSENSPIPGRLHLDHCPLEIRSNEESALIVLLRSAAYEFDLRIIYPESNPRRTMPLDQRTEEDRRKANDDLREDVARILAFVESEEYVAFAERIIRGDFEEFRGGYGKPP